MGWISDSFFSRRCEHGCRQSDYSSTWTRTRDRVINSHLLYQLSYRGMGCPLRRTGKRVTGIEPVTRAWKARMLPLHHTRRSGLTWERRWWWSLPMPSDSRRTRTFDRLLRRQLLYPTELASQVVVPIAANPEPPRGLPQLTMPALFRRSYNQQSHHTGL